MNGLTRGPVVLQFASSILNRQISTFTPRNCSHLTDDISKGTFLNGNIWTLIEISLWLFLCVLKTMSQHFSDNSLAPNWCQTVIWTNDGSIHWPIYVSHDLNKLRPEQFGRHLQTFFTKCICLEQKFYILIQISFMSVPSDYLFQLKINQHWSK